MNHQGRTAAQLESNARIGAIMAVGFVSLLTCALIWASLKAMAEWVP